MACETCGCPGGPHVRMASGLDITSVTFGGTDDLGEPSGFPGCTPNCKVYRSTATSSGSVGSVAAHAEGCHWLR